MVARVSGVLKAFIFDVDGTLVDSVDVHAKTWKDAFREFGHGVSFDDLRNQIGKGGDQLIAAFLSKEEIREIGAKLQSRRAEMLRESHLDSIRAFPRVRDLFECIRDRGMKIALASSAKGKELETYKQKADIEDLVEGETSSDDVERSKPHGDIFQAACDSLPGLGASEMIVVGDTPYDAEAAAKVGLRTIGLLSGGFAEERLRDAGCIAVFRDPAHLLDQIDDAIRLVD